MILPIISKLASESLLSLYPSIVKNIPISVELNMWSRFIVYVGLSAFFIDHGFIAKHLLSTDGIALSLITIAHVYTSYHGFMLLEGGTAYTLFYVYPIMILLMAGESLHPIMSFLVLGAWLLSMDVPKSKQKNKSLGYVMMFMAALTEALIYFAVRRLNTSNSWNHVFISYLFGAIGLTGMLSYTGSIHMESALSLSLLANGVIGLLGYFLRFFAISRLSPDIYAPLSYFGIIMSHVYGVAFNGDIITWNKIIGSLCIILPNYFLYRG